MIVLGYLCPVDAALIVTYINAVGSVAEMSKPHIGLIDFAQGFVGCGFRGYDVRLTGFVSHVFLWRFLG